MRLLCTITVIALALGVLCSSIAEQVLLHQRIAIVGPWVGFELVYNPGIAFGLRLPPTLQAFLIGLATATVIWIALRSDHTPLNQVGFGLIIGGALGNIVDRMLDGVVTDYVQVGSFPIFNLPDAFINIGVGLLLVEMLISKKRGN